MKNNIIFGVIALIALALVGFAYFNLKNEAVEIACPTDAQMCPDGSSVQRTGPSCTFPECPEKKENKFKDDLIVIDSPELNSAVTSPIQITGQARGTYFYEGSFPILVTDANGQIIGDGIATAQGDWATESFVPFTATVLYLPPQGTIGKNGNIILRNSNPSGLPENSIQRVIPVVLSEVK